MKTDNYPRIVRGPDIEVGAPRRGRPGYRWVTGWEIEYSDNCKSTPMRRADALQELKRARHEEHAS